MPARQKKTSASVSLTGERENIAHRNAAVSANRETVSLFGRFIGHFNDRQSAVSAGSAIKS